MKSTFVRLGGVTAVIGGLYLLILSIVQAFYAGDIDDGGVLWQTIPLMPILLILGVAGLLALADGHKGVQTGTVVIGLGAAFMAIGFTLMTWLDNDAGWSVMFLGLILQPIGFLVFGLANWRARILSRWNALPLIVGIITTLLLAVGIIAGDALGLTEQQNEQIFAVYLLTLAIGWVLIGVDMLLAGREKPVLSTATVSLFLLVLLLAACSSEPQVSFENLEDGETVANPVSVVMGAENFTVEPAGEIQEGAGHLHIMIDVPCLAPGEVIPKDDNHRHFGDGSTAADLELASGDHTLCLQAADGAHVALEGDGMTHEISLTVP
jgi:hypothetical protein